MKINTFKCQFCRSDVKSNEGYHGYIAMTMPVPEAEEQIDKWGRDNWWVNLERDDLTKEQEAELEGLAYYDQMLNTVGKGSSCIKCYEEEEKLLSKYYPY